MSHSIDSGHTRGSRSLWWLLLALLATAAAYSPGLSGGYLFDDFSSIVDNKALHLQDLGLSELSRAALSSPSSDFKRPLASLSFGFNHLLTGLDPFWMKLTNLCIHLLNGLLMFCLTRRLLRRSGQGDIRPGALAALITAGWLLLPINLSAVLYVVQRMESLANLFVLLGLLGYMVGRERMLDGQRGFWLCAMSLVVATSLGVLAKESAVMLPLYAICIEWLLFGFRGLDGKPSRAVTVLFLLVLALPLIIGLGWLLPYLLAPATWDTRDFTLGTRLLSEPRIVLSYVQWTLLPTPGALSFYHDDVEASAGLLSPWTTLPSLVLVLAMAAVVWVARRRAPLLSLGLAFFLGGHLLTASVLPLDLIYEHRNYFASFGLMLAVVPLLAVDGTRALAKPRRALLGALLLLWLGFSAMTAHAWGEPLRLARELVARNPESPRAQYDLGFTYIVYSQYRHESAFVPLARERLQIAAALPRSSILAEAALIAMSARMAMPQQDDWWRSLIAKLRNRKPSISDLTAMASLVSCEVAGDCDLPEHYMTQMFMAALAHPDPDGRLLSSYAGYAWNVLEDPRLALSMAREAVDADPAEPAHRITLIRILVAMGDGRNAAAALDGLRGLNHGGRLDGEIAALARSLADLGPVHQPR